MMRTRNKVLLALAAAILVVWLWQRFDLHAIMDDTTPAEFDSEPARAGQQPVMNLEELHAEFEADNDEFFGGRLPQATVVDYEEHDPGLEASTLKWTDGVFHISLNPVYATSDRHIGYLLLHESCHVKVWDATHNVDVYDKTNDHGRKWQSCMLGVDASGGFRRLLIDNYGGR